MLIDRFPLHDLIAGERREFEVDAVVEILLLDERQQMHQVRRAVALFGRLGSLRHVVDVAGETWCAV